MPLPLIDLRELRLGNARALLAHDVSSQLPDLQNSPTAYLQKIIDELSELSLKDPLTGLANRRQLKHELSRELDLVVRTGESAMLLMIDIDHFKNTNDTHGHLVGDVVLQTVAKCLCDCVRPMDTVARYGGDEFAVILPSCPDSFGSRIAQRICNEIESLTIPLPPQGHIKVTVSMGGAVVSEWLRTTVQAWTERADAQLYCAKFEGRNRVCIDTKTLLAVTDEEKNMLLNHLLLGEPALPGPLTGVSGMKLKRPDHHA